MSIKQFRMEDVRCFGEKQTLEIRPLTFLVGENSTGKTTALACFKVLVDFFQSRSIDFNLDPHSMGTFKDIVRNSRKKEKSFKLGVTYPYENENIELTVEFIESEKGIEPILGSMTMDLVDGRIEFIPKENDEQEIRVNVINEENNEYQIHIPSDIFNFFHFFPIFRSLLRETEEKTSLTTYLTEKYKVKDRYIQPFRNVENLSIFSTAPVRSSPKRTYDPSRISMDPEGSDIPMYLMRIEATEKNDWDTLKEKLIEFGKSSGLFQNIKIKNFGRSLGSPFQLQFKVSGPTSNILDVGYGISQILPLLVQVINPSTKQKSKKSNNSDYILLQQPEVHLHPRAQAEFSSLLANLASKGNCSYIVETHSDYMIDRARIEIRKRNIKADDVSLIYFEPKRTTVRVHNITFDAMGNLNNVPKHYRDFFLLETDRLMGFKD
ncbi:AAA family ATPase [Candidatus Poribacteria bacterium]|nr:AAA family ATPase [Candidatus Poribacteria bacterium]